jgi:mycothiol synthase
MTQGKLDLQVQGATDADRGAALELVYAHLPAEARAARIAQATDGASGADRTVWTAYRGEKLISAILVEVWPGKTAILSLPRTPGELSGRAIRELIGQIVARLTMQGVRLAQVLLPIEGGGEEALLVDCGFHRAATLLYLVGLNGRFPPAMPEEDCEFLPYKPALHGRLIQVVEQTYAGSLDCPSIDQVRAVEDVLEGYRAAGVFDPARWLIVRRGGHDVGCLLLTDDAAGDQWELSYMGVIPAARGLGLGSAIVRHAQYLAVLAGRERLVLAVDANNEPAVAVYTAANFIEWDQRRLFLRVL